MKVIKCTSDNRQAILDDAAQVLANGVGCRPSEAAVKTSTPTINTTVRLNRHLTTRRPEFSVYWRSISGLTACSTYTPGPTTGTRSPNPVTSFQPNGYTRDIVSSV